MLDVLDDEASSVTTLSDPQPVPTGIASVRIRKVSPEPEPADDLVAEWQPVKLDPRGFPDQPAGQGGLPPTIPNVRHLLAGNGISARYNLIKKRTEVFIPGLPGISDNVRSAALAHVRSLMAMHGMVMSDPRPILDAIANEVPYNPVKEWIDSRAWDGRNRLPEIYATLTTEEGFPAQLKETILHHWLLSAAAAALMQQGFSSRLVLTLSGPQSIGKTRWCMSLVSDPTLRASVVKTDHHFEGGDKDHVITAMQHWIAELGEVESSLRKDAERLKGIITRDRDVVRLPYAVADSEWPRRTVFMASANGSAFLVDPSGSTRWGIIPVTAVDHDHKIDMQQLWAQLAREVRDGAEWWLSPEQEAELETWNAQHRADSIVADAVAQVVDLDGGDTVRWQRMTASDVLRDGGIERPTTPQAREAGAILRGRFGNPTKSKTGMRWNLPIRRQVGEGDDDRVPAATSKKSKFD